MFQRFILLVFFLFFTLFCAERDPKLTFTMGQQAITMPWYLPPQFKSFNPNISVGFDREIKPLGNKTLTHQNEVGFIRHSFIESLLYIQSGIGWGIIRKKGGFFDVALKGGYGHWFNRRQVFILKDGEYVEKRNTGKPSLLIGIHLSYGFYLSRFPLSPYFKYSWMIQTPFIDDIPILSHNMLNLGIKLSIKKGR